MNIKIVETDNNKIAVIESNEIIINDAQTALDIAATVYYEYSAQCIVLPKSVVCEDFFKLSTGMAGEIMQKFVNYHFRIAIIGDFSGYTSKPLHDYIYECNSGQQICFVATEVEAIEKLSLHKS